MRFWSLACLLLACCSRDRRSPPEGSSSPAVASATSAFDDGTCRYLAADEAAKLLGAPVADGVPAKGRCSYPARDAKRGSVMLVIALQDGQGTLERQLRVFPRAEPVSGLGDQAFALGPMVGARFGSRFVSLSGVVPSAPTSVARDELVRLVRAIGTRLP